MVHRGVLAGIPTGGLPARLARLRRSTSPVRHLRQRHSRTVRFVDESTSAVPAPKGAYIGYEEFGRRFLEYAASEQRITGAFAQLAGAAFDFGPIGVGPAKLAKVAAQVRLG